MKQGAHSTLEAMPGRARPRPNLLIAHLSHFVSLSKDDISFLETLCEKQERVQKAVNLAEEGDAPSRGFTVCRGLACRYRDMPDGRRQILTFIMPGDFFGLHAFLMKSIDYSIIALTPTRLARIEQAQLIEIVEPDAAGGSVAARARCQARPGECPYPCSLSFLRILVAVPRGRIG